MISVDKKKAVGIGKKYLLSILLGLVSLPVLAAASELPSTPDYGGNLQRFKYAWPVRTFTFNSQQQKLHMAYLDVPPVHKDPSAKVALLLHGKNFCSDTWEETIRALTQRGYRVIAPDQIGFCKSSKPQHYQFSFRQLAYNTHALMEHLGINRYVMVGHSTGGMLGVRYALMYPQALSSLVLVDPIGLEDWSAKGVPYITIDDWYAEERKTSAEKIMQYEKHVYYADTWNNRYNKWVEMLAGEYNSHDRDAVAWDSALLYDMILTQPVVYELPQLKVPTLLMVGDKDITAIGAAFAPESVRKRLGHYPQLAKAAVKAIPHATLVEFPDMGHAPQIQSPKQFNAALLRWLDADRI